MTHVKSGSPDILPVLSRGRHRNPRRGGCFMEFASLLAGEAWSDHPNCTDPLLASLARMVNDCTSDAERSQLAVLIPSVIGLTSEDPRAGVLIAFRAATSALPVASADRQRALAVGTLACQRELARLDGTEDDAIREQVEQAFSHAPDTEHWAREFIAAVNPWSRTGFTRRTAEAIILISVQGIARACIHDADARLRELLTRAIADFSAVTGRTSDIPATLPAGFPVAPRGSKAAVPAV
jgi:hypothetical protein